jgi:hypothetical protein
VDKTVIEADMLTAHDEENVLGEATRLITEMRTALREILKRSSG